jgi:hypothetical protein
MATVTPNFTDNVSVVAAQVLARGSTVRGTLDLRTKFGAYAFAKIGRGGTTALAGGTTPGVDCLFRRVINNDTATAGGVHPVGSPAFLSSIAAASSTTVSGDSNSGQAVLNIGTLTGFAAGDIICIQDSGAGVTRLEWHRVSKTAGAGTMTLDRNLQFTHTAAQADTVRNKSDVFSPVWLPGGSLWECIFDYGDDTAGDSVTVSCLAETYDSETVV